MLKIGKYEVSDWCMKANSASRTVILKSEDIVILSKSILIIASFFDGASDDIYTIHFMGNILKKEYDSIYKDNC